MVAPFDDATDVADCESNAKDDCVSELTMNKVDCAWSDENAKLLKAAVDESLSWADADEGPESTVDWAALSEVEAEADAAADGEAPVLRGTLFCRYRRSPSMSSPVQRLA